MKTGRLFALVFVVNVAIYATAGIIILKLGRIAWAKYETQRDDKCRLALTVLTTRRDSVTYVVDHSCQALLPVKP